MSFVKLSTTQVQFLESFLRGTNRELTAAQAAATFGIKNLRARIYDLRHAGLIVKTRVNYAGRTAYRVVSRNNVGSRARMFA